MESDKVEKKTKQQLKEQYENLNPAELKRRIDKLQEKLSKLYLKRQRENAITDRISRISNTQNELTLKIIISVRQPNKFHIEN